jgi:hypothetical protein
MRKPITPEEKEQRRLEIEKLRNQGWTYVDISQQIHLCKTTIRQAYSNDGRNNSFYSSLLSDKQFWIDHRKESVLRLSNDWNIGCRTIFRWRKKAYEKWPELKNKDTTK